MLYNKIFFEMMEEYSRWFSMSRFDKPMIGKGNLQGIIPVPDWDRPDAIGRVILDLSFTFVSRDCYAKASISDMVTFNIRYKREWKTFFVTIELKPELYETPLGEFCTTISTDYGKTLKLKLTELIDKVGEYGQIVHFLSRFAKEKQTQTTE